MLELTVTIKRGHAIVGAIGPLLRGHGADQLTELIQWLVECGERRIVLHAAGVTVVDLDGMAAMVDSDVAVRGAGGTLVIAAPSPNLRIALRRSGLDRALDIDDAASVARPLFDNGAAS